MYSAVHSSNIKHPHWVVILAADGSSPTLGACLISADFSHKCSATQLRGPTDLDLILIQGLQHLQAVCLCPHWPG